MIMKYRELTKSQAVLALFMEVSCNPYRTPKEMMDCLGIGKYKYYRYLGEVNHFLSTVYGEEIVYRRDKKCYEFSQGGIKTRDVLRNPGDFYLFLLILQAISKFGEGSKEKSLCKLRGLMDEDMNAADLSKFYVFFESENPAGNLTENLFHINNAILSHRVIHFSYKGKEGDIPEIIVKPLRIVFDRWWYLYGIPSISDSPRNYKITRISDIEVLNESFEMPPKKYVNVKRVAQSWDFDDKKSVKVVIEIEGIKSRILQEEKIHPSQKTKVLPGGKIEVAFRVFSAQNMVPWILSLANNARVIEPDSLRNLVMEEAEKIADMYRHHDIA